MNKSQGDKLINYLVSLEEDESNIYENDITTKLISDIISNQFPQKSILIIDDLDRLDPEHLFRILNVFAAHFDSNSVYKNKFNFDKIILVCDINNVQKTFHHRYGSDVDFIGFIDKFYSQEIYHFENANAIKSIFQKCFEAIKFEKKLNDSDEYIRHIYFVDYFIDDFLRLAISQRYISLRNIIKLFDKQVDYHYETIYFNKNSDKIKSSINPIIFQLKFLSEIFGGYLGFINSIHKMNISEDFFENHKDRVADIIYVSSSQFHHFYTNTTFLFEVENNKIVVETKRLRNDNHFRSANLYVWSGTTLELETPEKIEELFITKKIFKHSLIEVVNQLHQVGYIK